MASKIDLSIPAWGNCPRFEFCQINKCPLHPDYFKLKNDPSDPAYKQRCIAKSIRKRIGKAFNLKNFGLTKRELSAQKKWAEMPESEKQEKIAILKKNSPLSQCLAKDLIVTPKKKSYLQNPHTKEEKSPENKATEQELKERNR